MYKRQEYEKAINDTYKYMLDQIQKEINGFYAKYARAEGITLSEAKRKDVYKRQEYNQRTETEQ